MRLTMVSLLGKGLVLSLIVILTGCQTTGSNGEKKTIDTAAFCDLAAPIYWSRKDTLKTIEQVKLHNAVGKRCGWGK